MKNAPIAWIASTQRQRSLRAEFFLFRLPMTWLRVLRLASLPSASGRPRISKLPWGNQVIFSISSNIIIYHSISWAHLCVLVFVYHDVYHYISCGIIIHDTTWYIVISQFVLWGLGLWSGDMISCDIMWYHVGWRAWSSKSDFGVISSYIIIYHV